ncbi:MAG: ATP synthase subunit I [Chthoniobacter sp.]
MNENLILFLSWIAGGALGALFFGGLWWTLRKGMASPRPALWFLGSLLVRMGLVLPGFYLVGRGHWLRLLLCLLGFITARLVVTWLTRPSGENVIPPSPEAGHAP